MNALPEPLDFDHVSPTTRLLEKKRQMFEIEDALRSQKQEYAIREEAFNRREENLRRKDKDLQESLIKFNKFLRENDAKRVRALKLAADEIKLRESKEREAKELSAQLVTAAAEDRRIRTELARVVHYKEFLEKVMNGPGGGGSKYFTEVSDVINRYRTLKEVNEYLVKKLTDDEATADCKSQQLTVFVAQQKRQTLASSNQVSCLRERLDKARHECAVARGVADESATVKLERSLELGVVLASVDNLYTRCMEEHSRRHGKPVMAVSSPSVGKSTSHGTRSGAQKPEQKSAHLLSQDKEEQCRVAMEQLEQIAANIVDLTAVAEQGKALCKGKGTNGPGMVKKNDAQTISTDTKSAITNI